MEKQLEKTLLIGSIIIAIAIIMSSLISSGNIKIQIPTQTTTTTSTYSPSAPSGGGGAGCAGAYIKVDRVTDSNIIYSNPTTESFTSITIVASDGTTITPDTDNLSPGQAVSQTITIGTSTSFILKGLCHGVPIEGSCRSGDSCWV
jgi:hypothetical protein